MSFDDVSAAALSMPVAFPFPILSAKRKIEMF